MIDKNMTEEMSKIRSEFKKFIGSQIFYGFLLIVFGVCIRLELMEIGSASIVNYAFIMTAVFAASTAKLYYLVCGKPLSKNTEPAPTQGE